MHGKRSRLPKKRAPKIKLRRTFVRLKPFSTVHRGIWMSAPMVLHVGMQHWPRKRHAKRSKIPKATATKSNTDSLACRRFLVTGRVQGVFFRVSTRDVAVQLSLTGYAKNLPDGRVEVVACGQFDAVDKLAAWLREGPRMASVTSVDDEAVEFREFDSFGLS